MDPLNTHPSVIPNCMQPLRDFSADHRRHPRSTEPPSRPFCLRTGALIYASKVFRLKRSQTTTPLALRPRQRCQTESLSHGNRTLCPRVDYPAVAFVPAPSGAPQGRPLPPPQTQRCLAHAAQRRAPPSTHKLVGRNSTTHEEEAPRSIKMTAHAPQPPTRDAITRVCYWTTYS